MITNGIANSSDKDLRRSEEPEPSSMISLSGFRGLFRLQMTLHAIETINHYINKNPQLFTNRPDLKKAWQAAFETGNSKTTFRKLVRGGRRSITQLNATETEIMSGLKILSNEICINPSVSFPLDRQLAYAMDSRVFTLGPIGKAEVSEVCKYVTAILLKH